MTPNQTLFRTTLLCVAKHALTKHDVTKHGSKHSVLAVLGLAIVLSLSSSSCSGGGSDHVQASGPTVTVGITKVVKKSLGRQITLSSELVPFEEIDVYAKESGYVKRSEEHTS